MATINDLRTMEGRTAVDTTGAEIGKIGQIYVDDQTSQPLWVTISTGLFGTRESFAPLYGSTSDGENLRLAVTMDMVKDAPGVEADGHIESDENEALYTYYDGYLASSSAQASPAAQYENQGSVDQGYAGQGYERQSNADVSGEDRSGQTDDPGTTSRQYS